ncbi:MAG TPA: carboxypeptidase-like regulatory domain-containing protein, partial [Armatimonadota bacterium]|nr:carboxypeptidase-like regulatory domain-containing protein [Armatimonadota bacterium]
MAVLAPHTAAAQAQAVNGNIEGTIRDSSGAALPGVMVTVTNMDTGTTRSSMTNTDGVYRAPLLPLGRYRVSAELQGFKTFEQQGITLSAGQTALINIDLSVGNVSETVTVTSEAPIAEPGKIDLGRTISESEVKNLPLVSRNPYNFAFLQANVTGYENNEFGVPRINANGSQMRTNYQLDGNTNTQKDRAGLRMLPVSEILVREVKVITNGFAPEFGQTTGMVYNA